MHKIIILHFIHKPLLTIKMFRYSIINVKEKSGNVIPYILF